MVPSPASSSPSSGHQHHDSLVKHVLTQPEAAAVQLRAALPSGLVERLDWATLAIEDASFVDVDLRPRHSDILYSVRTKGSGTTVLVYVLLEHQSSVDAMMAWRFHRYVTRIWEHYERKHGTIDALPLVIPLLLFQGPGNWTAPCRLSELIAVPPELAATLDPPVELVYAVDDLRCAITHDPSAREEIVAYVEVTRTLLFYAVRPDPIDPDPATLRRLEDLRTRFDIVRHRLGYEAAQTLLYYLSNAFRYRSRIHDAILEPIHAEVRDEMSTTYHEQLKAGAIAVMRERLLDEARRDGHARGLQQCLEQLLGSRGLLDDVARARLEGTHDYAQLQRWFARALNAQTTAEVFADS